MSSRQCGALLFAGGADHLQIADIYVTGFAPMTAFGYLAGHCDFVVQMLAHFDGVTLQTPGLSVFARDKVLIFLLWLLCQASVGGGEKKGASLAGRKGPATRLRYELYLRMPGAELPIDPREIPCAVAVRQL
jgi:hypothetical protein